MSQADPRSMLVVGAGVAGWRTAKETRKAGFDGPITVIGDEDEIPYDRPPLSKQVLTGEREPDSVRLTDDEEIGSLGIDLRRGVSATSVTADGVETSDGERLMADVVVIATGARAAVPPIVADQPAVRTLRGLGDSVGLAGDLDRAGSVLVLGGGFIGAEVAAAARAHGTDVTIVEAMPSLLGPLGPEVGGVVQGLHHDIGVHVLTGTPVSAVDAHDDGAEVELADGRVLSADLVVAGFGARINSEALGDLAGPDGIRCDDHGRVEGHPGLFAVGDVSAWHDPRSGRHVRREHWSSASDQAAIAAHAIVGLEATRFLESPPYFWTDQPGLKVQLLGWPELADREGWLEIEDVDPKSAYGWHHGDDLVAAAILGKPRLFVKLRKELIATGHRLGGSTVDDA
ncbi:NAD(P)/FAD-dependent oxidoreductase [Aeromicrobium sp.]|uniref:NAD(P)/FAD-dependent oxidoreductase n=1 Tax=Aeromicrobium sp. TaxID=1871063 RepID=UPI003C3D2215